MKISFEWPRMIDKDKGEIEEIPMRRSVVVVVNDEVADEADEEAVGNQGEERTTTLKIYMNTRIWKRAEMGSLIWVTEARA